MAKAKCATKSQVKGMIKKSEKRDEKKDKAMHENLDTKQMREMKKRVAKGKK